MWCDRRARTQRKGLQEKHREVGGATGGVEEASWGAGEGATNIEFNFGCVLAGGADGAEELGAGEPGERADEGGTNEWCILVIGGDN